MASALIACPSELSKALVNHDWRLRFAWDPRLDCWKIARLRSEWQDHPWCVYHPVSGKRLKCYVEVMHLRDRDSGAPLIPTWGHVRELRSRDLATQGVSPRQYLNELEEANRDYEKELEAERDEIRRPLIEAAERFERGHYSTGWKPAYQNAELGERN